MNYIYTAVEKCELGKILDAGPYRLNHIRDVGEAETEPYTYLVEPLSPIITSETSDESVIMVQRLRIMALLSDPKSQLVEAYLPSPDFDLNPALDSFLNGNPSPRMVQDCGRDFLVARVGEMHGIPVYAVTKVTFKRRNDITAGLLTLREAFRFSPNPVFLTQEFSSYSQRNHDDFGSLFLPSKGMRYSGLTRKQRDRKEVRIKRKLMKWNFT